MYLQSLAYLYDKKDDCYTHSHRFSACSAGNIVLPIFNNAGYVLFHMYLFLFSHYACMVLIVDDLYRHAEPRCQCAQRPWGNLSQVCPRRHSRWQVAAARYVHVDYAESMAG